jgi:flagellar hook-associated protein 2
MPVRMPGVGGSFDPKLVEQLIEAEKLPVESAKKRKEKFSTEKKEMEKLNGFLNELDSTLNSLKSRADFFKMKVESSHPDIIDGICKADALIGTYEFEVRGMARADKQLAYGFPDKDKSAVGFGYMEIEREDMGPAEITIEPGSTLQDVAKQINDAEAGVRAMVINTKYNPDSFRLLVISEKSGQEARVKLDEDTTFLEFKNQVAGQDLDVLFEDVPVTDTDNVLDELVDGVTFNVKRSEAGTRVQVNITHDIDKTMEGIKAFVDKYNQLSTFGHGQYMEDPQTGKRGLLAGEQSLSAVLRGVQSVIGNNQIPGGKFQTLADVGITTDPKTGNLKMDDAKVKSSLSEDYEGVAKLFIRGRDGLGIAEAMASKLKQLRDPGSGAVKSRMRALDNIIKSQDKDIERRERDAEQKGESIRRRFASLDGQIANMKSQGGILAQRMGGGGGASDGGGG